MFHSLPSTMTNSLLLLLAVSAASSATAFNSVHGMRRITNRVQMMTSDTPPPDSAVSTFASDSPVKSSDSGDLEIDFDSLASESAAKAFTPKSDISSMYVTPESRKNPRMAKWFPMLLSPESLDGTYAGDVGFDPLGFSGNGRIVKMREAEIKHARLAMLAAAGWPLSELWHKDFARMLGRCCCSMCVWQPVVSVATHGSSVQGQLQYHFSTHHRSFAPTPTPTSSPSLTIILFSHLSPHTTYHLPYTTLVIPTPQSSTTSWSAKARRRPSSTAG